LDQPAWHYNIVQRDTISWNIFSQTDLLIYISAQIHVKLIWKSGSFSSHYLRRGWKLQHMKLFY